MLNHIMIHISYGLYVIPYASLHNTVYHRDLKRLFLNFFFQVLIQVNIRNIQRMMTEYQIGHVMYMILENDIGIFILLNKKGLHIVFFVIQKSRIKTKLLTIGLIVFGWIVQVSKIIFKSSVLLKNMIVLILLIMIQ